MRSFIRLILIAASSFIVSFGCSADPAVSNVDAGVDVESDADTTEMDMGAPDSGEEDGGLSDDVGTDSDMDVVTLPPGPDRFIPGVSGEQRLGSQGFRLGVSVGAPGAPTLESEEYRLRLGPQPYLARPGAQTESTE